KVEVAAQPSASISADKLTITAGEQATLTYNVANVTSLWLEEVSDSDRKIISTSNRESWSSSAYYQINYLLKDTRTLNVWPKETTTYNLTARQPDNGKRWANPLGATASVTIVVNPAPPTPVTIIEPLPIFAQTVANDGTADTSDPFGFVFPADIGPTGLDGLLGSTDWNEGEEATETVTHIYAQPGQYKVSVRETADESWNEFELGQVYAGVTPDTLSTDNTGSRLGYRLIESVGEVPFYVGAEYPLTSRFNSTATRTIDWGDGVVEVLPASIVVAAVVKLPLPSDEEPSADVAPEPTLLAETGNIDESLIVSSEPSGSATVENYTVSPTTGPAPLDVTVKVPKNLFAALGGMFKINERLEWGDGEAIELDGNATTLTHQYKKIGQYELTRIQSFMGSETPTPLATITARIVKSPPTSEPPAPTDESGSTGEVPDGGYATGAVHPPLPDTTQEFIWPLRQSTPLPGAAGINSKVLDGVGDQNGISPTISQADLPITYYYSQWKEFAGLSKQIDWGDETVDELPQVVGRTAGEWWYSSTHQYEKAGGYEVYKINTFLGIKIRTKIATVWITEPPAATLLASKSVITAGEGTVLYWNVSNATKATKVKIDHGIGELLVTDANRSIFIAPKETTTFNLTAIRDDGGAPATASVTVVVNPADKDKPLGQPTDVKNNLVLQTD
ncbi:MAG: hypothetical protein AAB647_00695, partial [Patescibacteria group bacterium]